MKPRTSAGSNSVTANVALILSSAILAASMAIRSASNSSRDDPGTALDLCSLLPHTFCVMVFESCVPPLSGSSTTIATAVQSYEL